MNIDTRPLPGDNQTAASAAPIQPRTNGSPPDVPTAGNGNAPKAPALDAAPDVPEIDVKTDPEAVLRRECAHDAEAVLRRECHKHSLNNALDARVLYAFWSLSPSHLDDFRRQLALGVRPGTAARRQVREAMALADRLEVR